MSPGDVILICVSMVLAVAALLCAWDARKYAKQATAARERAAAAYAEIKRLRGDG